MHEYVNDAEGHSYYKILQLSALLGNHSGFILYISKHRQQIGFPKESQVMEKLYFYYAAFA